MGGKHKEVFMKKDLQEKLDHRLKVINQRKRQALTTVRENLRRLGKVQFIIDFAILNEVPLQVSTERIKRLRDRVTINDLAAAVTAAGIKNTDFALNIQNCEVSIGYNQIRENLNKKYEKAKFPKAKEKNCRAVRAWEKKRKNNAKELRNIILQ